MAKPTKISTWSNMDVFGLINGHSVWDQQFKSLKYVRKPFDNAIELRDRIYRDHENVGDNTYQGCVNAIHNEFKEDPYNVTTKQTFELTYEPVTVGEPDVQDINVYYQNYSGEWIEIKPQLWSHTYQDATNGFIVWQNEKYTNISGYKNYNYSQQLYILNELPDETEIKVIYSIYVEDENSNLQRIQYTDMDNPYDKDDVRFKYRTPSYPSNTGLFMFNMNNIPTPLYDQFYDSNGIAKFPLYMIRDFVDKKFNHKWKDMSDRSSIWDVNKLYGSGEVPHFYDAECPQNLMNLQNGTQLTYSGVTGGIQSKHKSMYSMEIEEVDGASAHNNWFIRLYPGKFYIDNIPFYLFESPNRTNLTFVSGVATLPSGCVRGAHTIMANSGYYTNPYVTEHPVLSGYVVEDYNYPTGQDGDKILSNIYRRKAYITSQMGSETILNKNEYCIDYKNNKIYSSGVTNTILIWEEVLIPSGRLVEHDLNPLNNTGTDLENFFLYLSIDPNRGI